VLKLLNQFWNSDLSWVMGSRFQVLMLSVIALNSVVIGMECDMSELWVWVYVEHSLLLIFSFELLVRLKVLGLGFFLGQEDIVWNWLDFIIVLGGIVDSWLMPFIGFVKETMGIGGGAKNSNVGQFMMLLRMARLLRILRLVRLVHSIPPLYQLILTIATAMQGMLWVFILSVIVLYIFALLAVRLISHGIIFGGEAPPEVAEIFPSVPQAIFVLFQVMNGDTSLIEPLFIILPFTQIVFMFFTIVSSWAILSILTAVVSDKMLETANRYRDEVEANEKSANQEKAIESVDEVFLKISEKEGNDSVLTDERRDALFSENREALGEMLEASGLSEEELRKLLVNLSRPRTLSSEDYVLTRKDFVKGFRSESRKVSMRSMVRLEKRLYDLEGIIGEKVGEILQKDGDDRMISHSARPTLMRKFTDNFMASTKPTSQQSPSSASSPTKGKKSVKSPRSPRSAPVKKDKSCRQQ
jgi:voltage-gated sodium channel